MQQLSYSELETTLTKYYYTKTHRGVGSGNYKDAAFANKLNRIPASLTVISKCHKSPKQLQRMRKRRADMNIKGLVHELFHNKVIKEASQQREMRWKITAISKCSMLISVQHLSTATEK